MNNISDQKKTVSFLESDGSCHRRAELRSGSSRDNDSLDTGLTKHQAVTENKKEVCVTQLSKEIYKGESKTHQPFVK